MVTTHSRGLPWKPKNLGYSSDFAMFNHKEAREVVVTGLLERIWSC